MNTKLYRTQPSTAIPEEPESDIWQGRSLLGA